LGRILWTSGSASLRDGLHHRDAVDIGANEKLVGVAVHRVGERVVLGEGVAGAAVAAEAVEDVAAW
jgi:hypothetical protein